jgi:hypothetical protein
MGRIKGAEHGNIAWRPRGSRVDIKISVRGKRFMDKEWIKISLDGVI